MPQQQIPIASMTTAELFATHNELAPSRGVALIATNAKRDHMDLATRVAILRATKPIHVVPVPVKRRTFWSADVEKKRKRPKRAPVQRATPIRDAVMAELVKISFFAYRKNGEKVSLRFANNLPNKRLLASYGFPYEDILARIKKLYPDSKLDCGDLRWHASMARNNANGFKGYRLPEKRQRSERKD